MKKIEDEFIDLICKYFRERAKESPKSQDLVNSSMNIPDKEKSDSLLKYFTSQSNSAAALIHTEPGMSLTKNRPDTYTQRSGNPMIEEKKPVISFMGVANQQNTFLRSTKQQFVDEKISMPVETTLVSQVNKASPCGIRAPPVSKSFQKFIDLDEIMPGTELKHPANIPKSENKSSSSGSSEGVHEEISMRKIARVVREIPDGPKVSRVALTKETLEKKPSRVAAKSKVTGASQHQSNSVASWLSSSGKNSKSQNIQNKSNTGSPKLPEDKSNIAENPVVKIKRTGANSNSVKDDKVIDIEEIKCDESKERGKIQISAELELPDANYRSTSIRGRGKKPVKTQQTDISNFMHRMS